MVYPSFAELFVGCRRGSSGGRVNASHSRCQPSSAILLERLQTEGRAGTPRDLRATVVPLKEAIVGDARPVLGLFAGAAILVLVVGCLNVGNMLLVRAVVREIDASEPVIEAAPVEELLAAQLSGPRTRSRHEPASAGEPLEPGRGPKEGVE